MPFLPFLHQPVQLHSARDAGPCRLTAEQCALKTRYWLFWYEADHVYALPVVYLGLAAVAGFALARLAADRAPRALARRAAVRRAVAALRFLAYRAWRVGGHHGAQPLGVLGLAALGAVVLAALVLGPRPYYWPAHARYGGSPPIATRSGWLALACLPFVLALAAKANLVSALTRVPPEKLNVWHAYLSWAMFVLALVHTFPFVVYHDAEGDTAREFRHGGVWLTGVIALVAQAWLTLMSVPCIRNRWYEFFKATHYLFAATFAVFFFLHCDFRLTSSDYFIAAAAVYLASLLYAVAKTHLKHGICHTARLRLETPHCLRIAVPTASNWGPGEHLYLRFLTGGIHALTAHPLTVCSLPRPHPHAKSGGELLFHVQPRAGLTARLARLAEKQPDVAIKVLLEGPYGGLPLRWSRGFDRTLLVAGGSGCGITLALIQDWLRGRDASSSSQLQVMLATRDAQMRVWYMHELRRVAERLTDAIARPGPIPGLSISLCETHASTAASPATQSSDLFSPSTDDEEKGQCEPGPRQDADANAVVALFGISFSRGRPDTAAALRRLSLQEPYGTVGVAVCGPSGMVHDVATEAAAQQQRILRGRDGASEVWLHKEAFSY